MSGKQGRKPTGRVNYIWILAGGYLFYLAYQLFSGLWEGDAENRC
jgi:threonine/homoserine/homoserine lactone efflux protein